MRCVYQFFILFLGITSFLQAQHKNEIGTYFGFFTEKPEVLFEMDCGGDLYLDNAYELGLNYAREIAKKFRLETGIIYFGSKLKHAENKQHTVSLISVPVYANYTFGKYIFVNAGPLLDFNLSESSYVATKSGVGFTLGVGAKYSFSNFLFYVNPNLKVRSFITFEAENDTEPIFAKMIDVGIRYRF